MDIMKIAIVVVAFIGSGTFTYDLMNKNYFEIILDRVECVFESPVTGQWHLKVRKVNKTRAIFGYVVFEYPLGNDIEINIKVLKKQGGEYRYLPFRIDNKPFCKFCAEDIYFYKALAQKSTLPEDLEKDCPLQPGNYTFFGATLDPGNIPPVALQTGEYAFEFIYYKDDKVVGIYRFYAFVNNV